jgi:hypothetical protein
MNFNRREGDDPYSSSSGLYSLLPATMIDRRFPADDVTSQQK